MNKKKLLVRLIKYGITFLVGGAMAYLVISNYGYSADLPDSDRYRILADAFTIPGTVIFLSGVLVAIQNEGMFYGISYAVSYAFKMLIPGLAGGNRHERYGDYVERKREKGPIRGYGFLFIAGGIFLAIAGIFIAMFYSLQ